MGRVRINVWRVLFLAALASVCIDAGNPLVEGDTLWHIKTGRWIIENHAIPTFDFYSWTAPGAAWVAHEWLWEVVACLCYAGAGKWGMWLLTCAGITTYALSLWGLLVRRCSLPLASVLTALALISASYVWDARPHVIAQGLFALTAYLVLTAQTNLKKLYLLPFIILIWVNMHSSAPLGVLFAAGVFVFPYLFKESAPFSSGTGIHRKLGGSVIAMILASFCSQQGPGIWYYTFFASSHPEITNNIGEWFSPNFHSPVLLPALILLLLMIVVPALKKKRPPLFEAVFAASACALWLVSLRHAPYFSLAGVLLLASTVKEIPAKRLNKAAATFLAAALIAFGAWSWPPAWLENPGEGVHFPIKAVSYMKESGLTDKVFNYYSWGGYLIWEGIPVFIDGRADMYVPSEKGVFRDYLRAIAPVYGKDVEGLEDPVEILNGWGVKTALIPSNGPLDWVLKKDVNWKEVYRDDVAVVYQKSG